MADGKGKDGKPVRTGKLSKIRKRLEEKYARCYWCEHSLTKDGDVPSEKVVEPLELFNMIVDAVRDDLKAYAVMCEAIARINALASYCVGEGIRGKIINLCEVALNHRNRLSGMCDAINCDMLRTYDDFVNAWNDYVMRSGNGSVSGFLAWLSRPVGKVDAEVCDD